VLLACLLMLSTSPVAAAAASDEPAEAKASPDHEASQEYGRTDRAADFGPAGVLFANTHHERDWSFFYQYQRIQKEGLLDGSNDVSVEAMLARGYTTVPKSQTDNRHTIGVMYTPIERLTFSLMLPYIEREMKLRDEDGFKEYRTAGIGDARLMFMVPFVTKGKERTQINLGLSFPTGSIQEEDRFGDRLPYAMQLGSGSWDLFWGMTYAGQRSIFSWGTEFEGIYRISDNSIGYRVGTVYHASGWLAGNLGDWLNASVRLLWTRQGNIRGEDPFLDLTKGTNPLNDNKRQAGTHVEIGPGVNVLLPFLGHQRLTFEIIWPIYQSLDGPLLADDVRLIGGYQWIF
jgi:hypothetical protein